MPGSTQQSAKYLHTKQKNRKKKTKNTTGVEKENSLRMRKKKEKKVYLCLCVKQKQKERSQTSLVFSVGVKKVIGRIQREQKNIMMRGRQGKKGNTKAVLTFKS